MIFTLSQDQEALVASATALTRRHFGTPASRADIPSHVSPTHWRHSRGTGSPA